MKVLIIGTDPVALDGPLPWSDVTRLAAPSVADGLKLAADTAPDMVVIHLDGSGVSPSEALQEFRCFTNAPLLVLDQKKRTLQAYIPTGQGGDLPVMLPPLPRKRRRAGPGTTRLPDSW